MNTVMPRRTRAGRILTVLLLAIALVPLGAQTLRLADLDLTTATIHQAGPSSFYVRGVVVDDETYSMVIEQDTSSTWTVTDIQAETSNILPPDTILDFATISVDGSTITIDGVLVGDSIYGGSLSVGEDADLALAEAIRTASNETVNSARSEALRAIIAAETEAAFRDQLAEQRDQYEAQLEELRAERDRLEGQLAAMPGTAVAAPTDASTTDPSGPDPGIDRAEPEPEVSDATATEPDAASTDPDPGIDRAEPDPEASDAAATAPEVPAEESAAGSDDTAVSPDNAADVPASTDPTATASPLSGDQVQALLTERDQLAGDIVGLVMENNELRAERTQLRQQISELQDRNAELIEDVSSMESEVGRLQELVDAYRSATGGGAGPDATATTAASDETVAPVPTWSFPGDYVRASDLEAAAEAVSREIRALESRVAALETATGGIAVVEERLGDATAVTVVEPDPVDPAPIDPTPEPDPEDLAETDESDGVTDAVARTEPTGDVVRPVLPIPGEDTFDLSFGPFERPLETASSVENEPSAPELEEVAEAPQDPVTREEAEAALESAAEAARIAELQAEVAELLAQNAQLRREQRAIEDRILNEILGNGFVRMMEARLDQELVSGFEVSEPDSGSWDMSEGTALQSDEDAFFAKLAMPAEQSDNPVLYSFSVRSLDEGWVGMGLHLFVSGVERRAGYGMGSSLLVWFTRDPDARGDDTTYLQVYRSDDDVNMARVLDAAIPESVVEFMDIDVLYEPTNQYITVAVNGVDRVRYRTWFGVDSGVELALRTLGRAEFRDFAVATER